VLVEWLKLRWSDFETHPDMVGTLENFLEACRAAGFPTEASVVARQLALRSMRLVKRPTAIKRTAAANAAVGLTYTEATPLLSTPHGTRACVHVFMRARARERERSSSTQLCTHPLSPSLCPRHLLSLSFSLFLTWRYV
jgi:hypothetical protein